MAVFEEFLPGKIQIQGEFIPDGGSDKQPLIKSRYVKGTPQVMGSILAASEFHPHLMELGMSMTIVESNPNEVVKITEYTLQIDPTTMVDPTTLESIVTVDNFLDFWILKNTITSNFSRVKEYAPDGANGSRPVFPYTILEEVNWTPVLDTSKNHKWERFRDDDVDDNSDGIFDNWTRPIPLGSSIIGGDFIANSYTRQNVNVINPVPTSQAELRITNLGAGDSGWFQVLVGNIDHDDGNIVTNLTVGRYFKYISTDTYTFNNSATAQQSLPPPNSSENGTSNDAGVYNSFSGLSTIIYTDDIPIGTDDLWEIVGQKTVYGALKSDWSIRKINENSSITRFAVSFSALPGTAANTSQDAGIDPYDSALDAIGWKGEFIDNTSYMSTRTDLGGGSWSEWTVIKVAGESGEFQDRVYKLFPINTDFDQEAAPGANPIDDGWSDTPLAETSDLINGMSEGTKYFDGTIKIPYSIPISNAGIDAFDDRISSDSGASFAYRPNSNDPTIPDPLDITLTAELRKGLTELWPTENITYVWTRVYNNGAIDASIANASTASDFYYLGTENTSGDPDYKRLAQRLFITPDGVDGKAVFECVQTYTLSDSSTISFTDTFVVTDVTDGLDAKSLDVNADTQNLFYNVTDSVFSIEEIRLSAFSDNLPTGFTLYWYVELAGVWSQLTSGVGGYTFAAQNYGAQMQIDATVIFAADGTLESHRYAVSTINKAVSGDPDDADNINSFSDFITITKADSSATAIDGLSAAFSQLDNESHVVVIDDVTGLPVAGEILTNGNARAVISVWEGNTKASEGVGLGRYSVVIDNTSNPNIVGAQQVSGTDIEIYIGSWMANEQRSNIKAIITYTPIDASLNDVVFTKVFSVNSTKDAVGAILMTINSDDGRYAFTSNNVTDINLTANLYNDKLTPALQDPTNFYFSWKVGNGAFGSVTQGGDDVTITRADVKNNALVEVRVFSVAVPSIPDDIIRSQSITINDILDGRTFRLYQADPPPIGGKPSEPSETINFTTGDGSWLPSVSDPVWGIDGTQKPFADWGNSSVPEYIWGDVYQIGGENGDQGFQGGGYYSLYSFYNNGAIKPTFPNGNTSTIAQMLSGSGPSAWQTEIPSSDKVWRVDRLFNGVTASGSPVIIDSAGVLVGGDATAAVPIIGSTWGEPIEISGIEGLPGTDGNTIRSGTVVPSNGLGIDGDLYLRTTTGDVYEKIGGIYSIIMNINGLPPVHQWSGTSLRFQNPNGSYGSYVDLKGDSKPYYRNFKGTSAGGAATNSSSSSYIYLDDSSIHNDHSETRQFLIKAGAHVRNNSSTLSKIVLLRLEIGGTPLADATTVLPPNNINHMIVQTTHVLEVSSGDHVNVEIGVHLLDDTGIFTDNGFIEVTGL